MTMPKNALSEYNEIYVKYQYDFTRESKIEV